MQQDVRAGDDPRHRPELALIEEIGQVLRD
jgi:hypothetical protein